MAAAFTYFPNRQYAPKQNSFAITYFNPYSNYRTASKTPYEVNSIRNIASVRPYYTNSACKNASVRPYKYVFISNNASVIIF